MPDHDADDADGTPVGDEPATGAGWPVELRGVTESVVTTLGPNDLWNVAALGLFADGGGDDGRGDDTDTVTATTWGNTRTRRNFHRRGEGYVQFTRDPVGFVDAALSITERENPVLESADAWARVTVEQIDAGEDDGTRWERWALVPAESDVERETVPTISRAFGAVVEATVAASRLGVAGSDDAALEDRLDHYAGVVERTGGPREREAFERLEAHADWQRDDRDGGPDAEGP